jgi:N12 class adenine-specific DNA methylase
MSGLAEARKNLPNLAGLDDASFVDALHQLYYPTMDKAALEAKLGYQAPQPAPQQAGVLRTVGDVGIKAAQGVVDVGSSIVGLGSLATGGLVGKGARALGYDPKRTNEILGEYLSDSQKASDDKVANADGFTDSVVASVQNPRSILGSVAQSAPGMLAGMGVTGAVARGVATKAALATAEGAAASAAELAAGRGAAQATKAALATKAGGQAASAAVEAAGGKLVALGAATEGAQSAGQIADDAQAAGREYSDYALPSLAAGVGTAAIGLGAGKLLGDSATSIATGAHSAGVRGKLATRVGKEFLSEGVLEEMPQSAQEQYFTNIAQGEQDRMKGVANAAGTGLVTGGVMGAGLGGAQRHDAAPPSPVVLPNSGPLSQAANAGQAAAAATAAAATANATAPQGTPAPAAPAAGDALPSLREIDARMDQLVAIGRGQLAQSALDATGNKVKVPAVDGRPLTAEEKSEYDALKQARAARVAIPQDQQAEYQALLAQEQAAHDAKTAPAIAAAAKSRSAQEEAQIQALLDEDARQAREAAAQREQEQIATTNAIVEHERQQRAQANRAALREQIIADPAVANKPAAFQAALKRGGYVNPEVTDEDHAEFAAAAEPVPSLPNELVDAVPERKQAVPAPAGTNTAAVDAAIASGMRLKTANGTVLHKPGSSKIFRLSTAQKAHYTAAIAALGQQNAPVVAENGQNNAVSRENDAVSREKAPENEPIVAPAANTVPESEAIPNALDLAAHEAATSPHNALPEPTQAQKEASNYKLGRVRLHGMDLSIENPAGSTRKGEDKDGTPWENTMAHHYGYIRGTVGADKDHIDTFIGPQPDSDKVFVVNQVHPDSRKFDEHKVMLGFDSLDAASAAYHGNYAPGWSGGDTIIETNVNGFKDWLANGQTRKRFPVGSQYGVVRAAHMKASSVPSQAQSSPATTTDTDQTSGAVADATPREADTARPAHAPADSVPQDASQAEPAPAPRRQALNRRTVKDMSDAELLEAKTLLADSPRVAKIGKEIAARSLESAATPVQEKAPAAPAAAQHGNTAAQVLASLGSITTWEQVAHAENALFDLAEAMRRTHPDLAPLAHLAADTVRIVKLFNEGNKEYKKEVAALRDNLQAVAKADPGPAASAAAAPSAAKSPKKGKAALGEATLRGDYGVEFIDGYEHTDEFPVERGGDLPAGGVKAAFLSDGQRYLKDVAGVLASQGYAPGPQRNGKPGKAVSVNEAGPAVSGEVTLSMVNESLGKGIHIDVSGSAVRGPMLPITASGVAVVARVTEPGNPSRTGQNLWQDPAMSAGQLAAKLHGIVADVASREKSDTLTPNTKEKEDHGHSNAGGEGAPSLGDLAAAQDGSAESAGRVERSDGGGRSGGASADRQPAAKRVSAARSGRSGLEPVYPADGGTSARDGLGSPGAGRDGERVPGQDARAESDVSAIAPAAAPSVPAFNFHITDDVRLGQGGEVQKFNDNLSAIRTMRAVEAENRHATPQEQAIMARYVGWGGLANAFPSPETGQFKDAWRQRGADLAELLSPKEYALARRSTLDSHYTSQTVVQSMWAAARRLGYQGGMALESSMGAGNFIGLMPEDVGARTKFIGVEYDNLTARIAALLYPNETVLNSGFQSVPLADGAFDLAIGNPPFGDQSLRFQFKPEINGHSIHNQFFLASLDALKPGGLQVQVVSRYLLDKLDKSSRVQLAKKARLLGAIRLPDTAFKENARTSVVTDMVFLQRLTPAEEATMEAAFAAAAQKPETSRQAEDERQALAAQVPEWVQTTELADPLGGDTMRVNTYFAKHPHMVMGVLERSGSMAYGNDITVRLDDPDSLAQRLAGAIKHLPQSVMTQTPDGISAAIARHKDMSDALRIALAGHENGSIKLEAGGVLHQVVERETPEGAFELTRRILAPESPWSDALYMDRDGKWYTIEAQMDEHGKPVKQVKNGKTTNLNVYDRKVFTSEADIPSAMLLGKTRYERLRQLVALRDLLKEQLSLEAEDAKTAAIEANRASLAAAYQAFVKEHGLVSEPANSSLVTNMPDGALVQALESGYRPAITAARAARIGEKVRPAAAEPAPILSKRVIVPYEAPTTADSLADAVAINMAEAGRVDLERIAALLGKDVAAVEAELAAADKPLLFKDPESGLWETRNSYLSGQVKRKLNAARAARLVQNINALEEVQPEPWGAENVTALLGSSWVPPSVYADFVQHIAGTAIARVAYSAVTNSYSVTGAATNRASEEEWGSPGYTSVELIAALLNNSAIKVVYYDKDGGAHVDQEKTALALLKAKAISTEFSDWVYKDGARRNQLVEIFNEKFNTRVMRQHDGSHLFLPGKVPDAVIAMRRHQKNTIWRGISERFMLVDHTVGAGKTYTAIARAMERRRMGLSKKPTMVVPNHMVEQFTSDVYRLYPAAKVLAAGKKDFEKSRRRQLFAKIATGDYDIVILPHSSFGFIGIAPETEERFLQQELDAAVAAVAEAEEEAEDSGQAGFRKPFGVKEAERLVDKLTARMEKVKGDKNKDRLLTFEQMGIDDLTVDEAHEFKNLFYSSRLTGVKGMGNKTGSQKAFDLYNKVRVLRESPTGTVTFLTGTPISNSAVEMYNMMRYLAADELKELGLEHFDAWRAQFVSTDAGWEPTETGRLKEVNRLGRTWSNMRSLMDLYYSFTDSVDNDDIKRAYAEDNGGEAFPIPRVAGGDRQSVVMAPTKAQINLLDEVLEGFDGLPNIVDPYERNKARLRLMDRARKVSLDVRAANPHSTSREEGGKLDVIADNVKRIYDKWHADRGTQLIFLDRSVPKAKGDDAVLKEYDALLAAQRQALKDQNEGAMRAAGEKLERFDPNEMEELRNAQAGGWNAYQQIKDNLIARGIPAAEIRFVQEANTDAQKQALFDAVNDGTVRVLLGSTPRMGAGTNVQQRIVAVHHADVTWKPSDIEQREGRGVRQGNKLLAKYGIDAFELEILAYATERTIDAKMWALNSSKLKTINAIRKYDGAFSMDFEDEESVSMAELAALASGDPLLLERVKLVSEIDKLELLKRQHARKQWGITSQIEDAESSVAKLPARIKMAESDLADVHAGLSAQEQAVSARSVSVEGEHFNDGAAARRAVMEAVTAQQGGDDKAKVSVKVNGRRLASLDGAMAAVGAALGDQQPFHMTVNGQDLGARTDAARAIAEIAAEVSGELGENAAKTVDIGQFRGLPLQATMEHDSNAGYWTSLAVLRWDGSTLATGDTNWRENPEYTTSAMRTAVEDLEKTLNPSGLTSAIGNFTRRLAAAEASLPDLRARQGGPFAQQGELDAKHARLETVIRELSSGPSTPARAIVARSNPLRRADGSYMRQAPAEAQFSRARIDTDDQLVNIFSQLASDDDAFRLPGSEAKTLAGVLAEVGPSMTVDEFYSQGEEEDAATPVDRVWQITSPDGELAWVYKNNKNKEVWLDISNWKEGKLGAQVYQAVATFAHNTKQVFIGDPQGLSDKALYRRTEQMISSALRHGTTAHLAPHARQVEAIQTATGVPVRPVAWRTGDDAHNLRELLLSSYTNILHVFPEIADVHYNFSRARFERDAAPVRASSGALLADQSAAGEQADADGLGSGGDRSTAGRGAAGPDEAEGQLARVDAVPFTDADFAAAAGSLRRAYDALFPSHRGAYTPPIGVSDLKRAALVAAVLREEGRDGGRDVLDHVADRLLQRVSTPLAGVLYSRDAEYFRDEARAFLPPVPAGHDAGTAAPLVLTGAELLAAKKTTEQLNRVLAKEGMAPVRALRTAPNAGFALARQAGKALGIDVNFVSANGDFEGVAYRGTAYLAESLHNPVLAIAGHETLHALEQSNPALGAKLRERIRAHLKDGVVADRQLREYVAAGLQDVPMEQAEAEVIADINGAMWLEPVFWSDLAKADRSLFRQVAYKFMEVAAKLIGALRGSRWDAANLVRDVEAVRAILVDTWAEHAAAQGQGSAPRTLHEPGPSGYNDAYEHTDTRPGSTDAQLRTGRAAVEALSRRLGVDRIGEGNPAGRGAATVLGSRLLAGFVAGQPNELVGQVVHTPADLAALAQVYRDPRFETFRVLYTAGDQIVGEAGYTSRLPASVGTPNNLNAQVAADKARFGADGYYLLHNHPSGRATPSDADVDLTTGTAAAVSGMRGHVVIDHNEYAIIDAAGAHDLVAAPELNGVDFTGAPELEHQLLGVAIKGPGYVAQLAKALQIPAGHAALVLTDIHGAVQLLVDVPMGALTDTSKRGLAKGKGVLRRMVRETGSGGHRFLALPEGADVDAFAPWVEAGVITDVVSADAQTARVNGATWGTDFLAHSPTVHTLVNEAGDAAAYSRTGLGERLAGAANSIEDLRLPAGYRLGDLFNSSGKLNWWHKTLGTMDNLAKRRPIFAPVYEAVQRFLGDVSRYAVVAADMAPTLLPKLENIADIIGKNRKKPLTAEDSKAIAAPIFEGTLSWARDANGAPISMADLEAQAEQMSTADKARILLAKGIIDHQQHQAWLASPLGIYDASINSRYTATQLQGGVVWSDAELRDKFSLSDAQIALYREFRAALDKSLTNLTISEMVKLGGKDAKSLQEQAVAEPSLAQAANLLRDHFIALAKLHPEQTDMHLDTASQIMNLADKGQGLMDRGYAPLSRFGKYTVYVQDGEEQVYFGMFESQHEAAKMARDMREAHAGALVTQGTVSEDAYKLFAGVSPETIELFGSMVGLDSQADAASTEVYQAYLKLAKNNRSAMKRMIQRKGIAGFSEDAGRVLAGFIYSNARLTAGNAHLGEIDEAVTAIPKQEGELTDAAMQLREHIRNPEGGGHQLGGLMFAQFLGGSVASAMVNLTQPFTMTLPYLSQWGGLAKAGKALADAVKLAGKDSTGDADLDAALKWAEDEGIVAPQEVHYLQAQASGKGSLRTGDGTLAGNTRAHLNNAMAKVSLGWGKLFAMAELANRRITFIAAYRTAIAQGMGNPAKFAQEAVSQTQGTYNSGNKPRWARGTIGSLLLTFKQYSIGYLELLTRMAMAGEPGSKERAAGRRAALYMVAVLFLMSGADGLPFEQDLEDALDGIMQRLGYNFATKRAKQAFLTNVLGQGGADFALKGISSLPGMPVDVAGRFGMGNLIPGTGLLQKKESYTRDLGELAGPAGDLAARAFSGAGKLLGGDIAGAALDVSPASVRNVIKGADMLASGSYNDARGYRVNDTSTTEGIMKIIGFQPNSTADIQDAKGQALNMLAQTRMRQAEIAEHWAQGIAQNDAGMVQAARDWRDDWNAKNPEAPVKVSMPGVLKRVRSMRQDAANRTQKSAPVALKATVSRELAETRG